MLTSVGNFIEKKPYIVIVAVLLVTLAFSASIPLMESGTSMSDFLPDNEIVRANQKVMDYFEGNYEILMVYAKAKNVTSPTSIREQYRLTEELYTRNFVEGVIGIPLFINNVCFMEYGRDIDNCSDREIQDAFSDIMSNRKNVTILSSPDPKESKIQNSLNIKNAFIKDNNTSLIFTIEVYQLSDLTNLHSNPVEWNILFGNKFIFSEEMNVSYKLSARLEPKPVWILGDGLFQNVKNMRSRNLFRFYEKNVYLWIKPPHRDIWFPVMLKNAKFDIEQTKNQIVVTVKKEELQRFGIAPKFMGMEFPAKLNRLKVETRVYGLTKLNLPWFRISVNSTFISNLIEWSQSRSLIKRISDTILSRYGISSIDEIKDFEKFLDKNYTISLKDIDKNWKTVDTAPDDGFSDVTFLIKPRFMEDLKQSVLSFLSKEEDYSSTLLILQINGSIDRETLKETSREIEQMLINEGKSAEMEFSITGYGVISYQIDELTSRSNAIIGPSIFIAIMLILLINFRRPSYVLLPMLGLVVSIIWLFGTMAILHIKFNTIAVALVPLIMGLGVDYSVHMFHNYRREIEKGKTPGKAISSSIRDVGTAMLLATVTTCIGFLSFLTSSVPPIRDFGILCAIGIVYTFIVTISLQASLRYILDKNKKKEKIKTRRFPLKDAMEKVAKQTCRHSRAIALSFAIMTLIMAYGAINLETTFNMEDFLPKDTPAIETMETIADKFPSSSQDQEYILIEGNVATVETLNAIYETIENIEDDIYVVHNPDGSPRVESIISIIRDAVRYNNSLIDKFNLDNRCIPRSDRDVKNLLDYLYERYEMSVKAVLYREENRYRAALIRVYISETNGNHTDEIYDELNNDLTSYKNAEAIVTGRYSLIYTITKSLTESQMRSTIICLFLAALVIILAYRRIFLGIITMIPVSLSSLWILGTMYFAGYSLNVMTVMITSLTIGLGVTYAVHAVERFRLIFDKTGDVDKAVHEATSHTGSAILAAAVTTIAGFGILILSPMPPEQQFGIITAMTIFYTLVTTLIILPPILAAYGRWIKRRTNHS